MLKCVECGHLVKEKEEFCDGCGASMEVYNRWFKGAEENDAFSQASLGVIYRNEKLSVVDLEKSFYWTKKGAEGGDSNAQGALGGMYLNGQGTEVDFEKSYYWTRKSAYQ